jgi:serine protease AprX
VKPYFIALLGLEPFLQRYNLQIEIHSMSRNAHIRTPRSISRLLRRFGVLLVLLAASPSFAKNSAKPHVSPELAQFADAVKNGKLSKNQKVQVIVQFTKTPSQKNLQKVAGLGGRHLKSFNSIRGGLFTIPLSALAVLASDSDIAYVTPDRSLKGSSTDAFEQAIAADVAHSYGWDGTGVGVAVIDSGISDHPDLHDPATGQSRVVYSESFVPGTDGSDGYGHGTHVAGIIGGNGTLSSGWISGVAPHVNLIDLRVLDSTGAGSDSYVISAVERAIALKDTYNIRVINLSLGRPVYETFAQDPLCQVVESAWKAGIVVVAAAGNMGRDNEFGTNGYGLIGVPGADPYVITVGSMNTVGTAGKLDDVLATYSSKGPTMVDHIVKPDLVAPGNRIESLLAPGNFLAQELPQNVVNPLEYGDTSGQPGYLALSGTSMATPVVAGAAALLLQQDPTLTPDAVKARLMKTADKTFPTESVIVDPATGESFTKTLRPLCRGRWLFGLGRCPGRHSTGFRFGSLACRRAQC